MRKELMFIQGEVDRSMSIVGPVGLVSGVVISTAKLSGNQTRFCHSTW